MALQVFLNELKRITLGEFMDDLEIGKHIQESLGINLPN